jgi:hypothetical protein
MMLGLVGALLLVAVACAIGSLNRDVFSAKGFVAQYLSSLERRDAASVLAMPGVVPSDTEIPEGSSAALLRGSALGALSDIEILDEAAQPDGTYIVSASYVVGATPAVGMFHVFDAGNTFLVFDTWAFATPPLGTVNLTVSHDSVFTVGTSGLIDLRTTHPTNTGTFGATGTFLVLAPGNYTFGHTSRLLAAKPVTATVIGPGADATATVDVQANAAFNGEVQKQLDEFLDECVTQTVLQPTGCPFGYQTGNRLVGEPTWSLVAYPEISIVAGDTGWVVRNAIATVELTGELQSLYDGTITPLDEIIDANINLDITIAPDGSLLITVI